MRPITVSRQIAKLFKVVSLLSAIFILFFLYNKANNPISVQGTNSNEVKHPMPYEITVENSIFEGINKHHTPYIINARKAVKVSDEIYNLEKINGKYYIKDKEVIIISDVGHINNLTNLLYLEGNIQAIMEEGTFYGKSLNINLQTQEVISNAPVKIVFRNSEINANSLNIKDENIITFEGEVIAKFHIQDFSNN